MPGTYVTDLRHFLDDDGDLASGIPSEARQMASFLALIVDAVSMESPGPFHETGMRCRIKQCIGGVLARVDRANQEIHWECSLCGHHGQISNWQNTKWDQRCG